MLLDIAGICLPADSLNDQAEDVEVHVAVFELSARRSANLQRDRSHLALDFVWTAAEIGQADHAGQLRQAAGLVRRWRTVIWADACGSATRNQGG